MDLATVALAIYPQMIAKVTTNTPITDIMRERTAFEAFQWAEAFMKVASGDSKVK